MCLLLAPEDTRLEGSAMYLYACKNDPANFVGRFFGGWNFQIHNFDTFEMLARLEIRWVHMNIKL